MIDGCGAKTHTRLFEKKREKSPNWPPSRLGQCGRIVCGEDSAAGLRGLVRLRVAAPDGEMPCLQKLEIA
jgi:hypothetical protein